MSQSTEILMWLKGGHKLTPLEALNQFGCFRLSARVDDLKKQGHKIESKMIEVESGKKVAQYWLPQVAQRGLFD